MDLGPECPYKSLNDMSAVTGKRIPPATGKRLQIAPKPAVEAKDAPFIPPQAVNGNPMSTTAPVANPMADSVFPPSPQGTSNGIFHDDSSNLMLDLIPPSAKRQKVDVPEADQGLNTEGLSLKEVELVDLFFATIQMTGMRYPLQLDNRLAVARDQIAQAHDTKTALRSLDPEHAQVFWRFIADHCVSDEARDAIFTCL